MKELNLNEFLNRADDYINNAVIGQDVYTVQTNCGKAIILSEEEWKRLLSIKENIIDQGTIIMVSLSHRLILTYLFYPFFLSFHIQVHISL